MPVEAIKSIETTIETSKTIEDCVNHKDKEVGRNGFDEFRKLINRIGKKRYLVENLFEINTRLNKEVLCEGCKRKEIRKLADKYGNEEIAKFPYGCRLNAKDDDYTRLISFDEFKNIEYLAKCGFGEVHKATWIKHDYDRDKHKEEYKEKKDALKRIYNSSDKIVNILKEVKVHC